MEPSQSIKYYNNKVKLDDCDENIIEKYIKTSMPKKKYSVSEIFHIVVTKIEKIVTDIHNGILENVSKKKPLIFILKDTLCEKDAHCITSIFLHHFPEYEIDTELTSLKGDHLIFPDFCGGYVCKLTINLQSVGINLQSAGEKNWNDAKKAKGTDLRINCGANGNYRHFYAHSFILNAVPFFRDLIESSIKEIQFGDVCPRAVEHMLQYAYLGSFSEVDPKNLSKILSIARKCKYDPLQKYVLDRLSKDFRLHDKFIMSNLHVGEIEFMIAKMKDRIGTNSSEISTSEDDSEDSKYPPGMNMKFSVSDAQKEKWLLSRLENCLNQKKQAMTKLTKGDNFQG